MTKNQKITILAVSIFLIGTVAYVSSGPSGGNETPSVVQSVKAEVHHDPGCGCCAQYVSYLRREGLDVTSDKKPSSEIQEIKADYKVSRSDASCHTSIIEGYVVEGHIPVEAIEKLLEEQPDIIGIAMGGMPSGSPGMPGRQAETFTINQIENDGTTSVFMEI